MTSQLISTYRHCTSPSLIDDRLEYDEEELASSYPLLTPAEAHLLFLLINAPYEPKLLPETNRLLITFAHENRGHTRMAAYRIFAQLNSH